MCICVWKINSWAVEEKPWIVRGKGRFFLEIKISKIWENLEGEMEKIKLNWKLIWLLICMTSYIYNIK